MSSNVAGVNLSGTALPAGNSHTGNNITICVNVYRSCRSLVARMLVWEIVKMINVSESFNSQRKEDSCETDW